MVGRRRLSFVPRKRRDLFLFSVLSHDVESPRTRRDGNAGEHFEDCPFPSTLSRCTPNPGQTMDRGTTPSHQPAYHLISASFSFFTANVFFLVFFFRLKDV